MEISLQSDPNVEAGMMHLGKGLLCTMQNYYRAGISFVPNN